MLCRSGPKGSCTGVFFGERIPWDGARAGDCICGVVSNSPEDVRNNGQCCMAVGWVLLHDRGPGDVLGALHFSQAAGCPVNSNGRISEPRRTGICSRMGGRDPPHWKCNGASHDGGLCDCKALRKGCAFDLGWDMQARYLCFHCYILLCPGLCLLFVGLVVLTYCLCVNGICCSVSVSLLCRPGGQKISAITSTHGNTTATAVPANDANGTDR